jgi:hypothetical protein
MPTTQERVPVATRPTAGLPRLSRRSRILLIIGFVLLILLISGSHLLDTYISWLWFGEVGFRSVFSTILFTRIVLFFAIGVFVGGALALSLFIAYRTRPVFVPVSGTDDPLSRYRSVITRRRKWFGLGIPIAIGLIAGGSANNDWQLVQLAMHATSFGIADPQFGHDISFYEFVLPLILWVQNWLFIAVTLAFFGALISHYIFGGIRLAGRGGQLSTPARVQLAILIGFFVLLKAFAYFTDRYQLLWGDRDTQFTGATYTDVNALMPAKLILLCIAIFCALGFFAGAFLRNLQLPAIALVLLVLSSILIGAAWPAVLQQFSVSGNANQKEAQYIQRANTATLQAYGLAGNVTYQSYDPTNVNNTATASSLLNDTGTIPNVRVLDPNVLSPTFTQQQHANTNIYGFPNELNLDRYTINGNTQDYVVAAREMDPANLSSAQQNWISQHLIYTHGDGFIAAPADEVSAAGYPQYDVSDLSNDGKGAIPVDQTRIYYGLLAGDDYAIVGQKVNGKNTEYDGTNPNGYTYDGSGGVSLSNWFNRLAFATYYGSRYFLFSGDIGDNSKIIFQRNPVQRVQQIAPWLTTDSDPYPAVVNDSDGKNRIAWIVDCYTTLQNYPYGQQTFLNSPTTSSLNGPGQPVGYVRNSVKAVVDAYSGKVTLYQVDNNDPVLKAWEGVFPGVVQPSSSIPKTLSDHFRYPQDLFNIQRNLLNNYHVTNPQDFFSSAGFWSVPGDPTENPDGTISTSVTGPSGNSPNQQPYYVLAQSPGQQSPTFQLTSALTILNSQNMAAWMSVSSDPNNYGKITVLTLPTGTPTLGPEQVQSQFETSPKFTENKTFLSNSTVKPLYGNLLTLPVAGGLLFVEPVYTESTGNSANGGGYPQLADVLTAFGGKVGFAPTLQESISNLFSAAPTTPSSPGSSSTTSPPTTTTTAPPSTNSAGVPPPGGGGGVPPALSKAVSDINKALQDIANAQQSKDFAALGNAYAELQTATNEFNAAQAAMSSTSNPPPPTPTTH